MELRELCSDPFSVCQIQFFQVHADPPALECSVHSSAFLWVWDKKMRDKDLG
jgi:hypothetical protein